MAGLRRTDDALMVVGSSSHEPGQLAFEDLGCSAACEEEKAALKRKILQMEERNRVLELYLTRYSNQETDDFLKRLKETRDQLKQFQRHIGLMPHLVGIFEHFIRRELAKQEGKKWQSVQAALQHVRTNEPHLLGCADPAGKYQEFMLPLYARWIVERNPEWEGAIEIRQSRFDGYRPWAESYEEEDGTEDG